MQASPEEPATGPPLDEGPAKPVISTQVPSSSIQAQDSPGSQQQDETPTVEPTQLSAVAASENQQQTSGQATSLPHIPSTGGGLKKGPRSSVQPPRRPASHLDAAPRLSARQAAKRQRMAQVQALNEDADEKTAAELLLGMQSLSGSQVSCGCQSQQVEPLNLSETTAQCYRLPTAVAIVLALLCPASHASDTRLRGGPRPLLLSPTTCLSGAQCASPFHIPCQNCAL